MELDNNLSAKLIADNVLNKELPQEVKMFLAKSMLVWGDSHINMLLHYALHKPNVHIYKEGDYILYEIHKAYRLKELGDHTSLVDKGLVYNYNGKLLYLGQIKGSGSYGDFNPYASDFRITCYGINDGQIIAQKFQENNKHLNFIYGVGIDSINSFFKYDNTFKNVFSDNVFKIIKGNKILNSYATFISN